MGFFKEVAKLRRSTDPAEQMRSGIESMKAVNATMGTTVDTFRLRAEGRKAKGTILAMEDTGMTVGASAVLHFRVRIDDGDADPYEVELDRAQQMGEAGVFQVGKVLVVYVDREDPQRVAW